MNTYRANTLTEPPHSHTQPPGPFLGSAPAVIIDSALVRAAAQRAQQAGKSKRRRGFYQKNAKVHWVLNTLINVNQLHCCYFNLEHMVK